MQRALILGFFWLCACSRREQSAAPISATATAVPASPSAAPPITHSGDKRKTSPTSEAECTSTCNGKWGRHGLAPNESCLCRTSDGGKRCRDGAECEGECVLEDPPLTEVVEKGPPARGYFVGTCSPFATAFGCLARLGQGVVKAGPVDLSEPPGKLCAD